MWKRILVGFVLLSSSAVHGFAPVQTTHHVRSKSNDKHASHFPPASAQLTLRGGAVPSTTAQQLVATSATASLVAGSIAGAIGVGVAFPFDTLKTKAQVLTTIADDGSSTGGNSMTAVIQYVYRQEGIAGFFGGVRAMMIGQAIIKSVAFSVNASALMYLQQQLALQPAAALLLASCFAGFVTSFLVVPIERIKVMMQAANIYPNEIECIKAVLRREGFWGLMGRGLGPTLAREVPSYAIYFCVYGLLMQTVLAATMGSVAPLVFGALAGCASWLPVYPVDVVKTLVQNTEGGADGQVSSWQVATDLYRKEGIGAFFDGLTPKMLRAAINHSVTFWVYDLLIHALVPTSMS